MIYTYTRDSTSPRFYTEWKPMCEKPRMVTKRRADLNYRHNYILLPVFLPLAPFQFLLSSKSKLDVAKPHLKLSYL